MLSYTSSQRVTDSSSTSRSLMFPFPPQEAANFVLNAWAGLKMIPKVMQRATLGNPQQEIILKRWLSKKLPPSLDTMHHSCKYQPTNLNFRHQRASNLKNNKHTLENPLSQETRRLFKHHYTSHVFYQQRAGNCHPSEKHPPTMFPLMACIAVCR